MRGGYLHNSVLLDPIERHFRSVGAELHREFRIPSKRLLGFVDLFVQLGSECICCEAELSVDRVLRDLQKAVEVQASELLVVVPEARLAETIRRRLRGEIRHGQLPRVVVQPLGVALHHVRTCFPFPPAVNPPGKTNDKPRAEGGAS